MVMAHELSHILLHSIYHREKSNEIYTDLTAMLLGFGFVVRMGRKTTKVSITGDKYDYRISHKLTETATYGYLTDDNLIFAFNYIYDEYEKQKNTQKKVLKTANKIKEMMDRTLKLFNYFDTFIEYLDGKMNTSIPQNDAKSICAFMHMVMEMLERRY